MRVPLAQQVVLGVLALMVIGLGCLRQPLRPMALSWRFSDG